MYYDRILTEVEALYVSRARQKIAELSASIAVETSRNDVTYRDTQLIVELNYSILSLASSTLNWSLEEILSVINFYTLEADLAEFSYRDIDFLAPSIGGVSNCATLQDLSSMHLTIINYIDEEDAALRKLILEKEQESKDRDEALDQKIAAGNAAWRGDFTVTNPLGGVPINKVYVEGEPLENTLRQLLSTPVTVSNFIYNSYLAIVEVGTNIVVSSFSWAVSGGVLVNPKIVGSGLDEEVTTSPFSSPPLPKQYVMSDLGSITWQLQADNVPTLSLTTRALYKSYAGKTTTGVTPTAEAIKASVNWLGDTSSEVQFNMVVTNEEFGWIAVPKVQTGAAYTAWWVDAINNSNIENGDFIVPPVDVAIDGTVYSVYKWGYASGLSDTLKLYRP